MGLDTDAHHNIGMPVDEECPMFLQAVENLRQAKEALRIAQEAYDTLASRRPVKIRARRRKILQDCRSSTDEEERARRQEFKGSTTVQRLRLQEQAKKRAFVHSFRPENSIEQPSEGLVPLFQKVRSLDQFAKRLEITRRDAIRALKASRYDVVEEIAKEWENGKSLRVLSKVHGPTPQTISKWIKSTGRRIKPRNSNQKYNRPRMYELFDGGWTTNKIAETMRLSWATVQSCKKSWWDAKNTQD